MTDELDPGMFNITVDPDDLRDPDEPAPAGLYAFRVRQANLRLSSKGRPMIMIGSEISEGDHAGSFVNDFCMVTGGDRAEKAGWWRLREYCASFGLDVKELMTWVADNLEDLDPQDEEMARIDLPEGWAGAEGEFELSVSPARGDYSASNRVQQVMP